ncbi:hypothetical protein D3C71_1623270 [compost metagenome]
MAQRRRVFDGVDQIGRRWILAQRLLKHWPVKQARSLIRLPGPDHEHVGHFIGGATDAPAWREGQWANHDLLAIHPAICVEHLHHGGDIAITGFVDAMLLANLQLQGQQR